MIYTSKINNQKQKDTRIYSIKIEIKNKIVKRSIEINIDSARIRSMIKNKVYIQMVTRQ